MTTSVIAPVASVIVISKDEWALDETLTGLTAEAAATDGNVEIVVVDASSGRLDGIRRAHPEVCWIDYVRPPDVDVTIPHQRNVGVRASRGEICVFTDAGCTPEPGWLDRLIEPIRARTVTVTAGLTLSPSGDGQYDADARARSHHEYLTECPTINVAFTRGAFDDVHGFDEGFAYGSDIDFSWRLHDAGHRIRSVPDAVVRHDWGDARRQARRSFRYGQARVRLYRKHRERRTQLFRGDPVALAYSLFLLGLPLTLRWRAYPALMLVPAWRNRGPHVAATLVDHLVFATGVLVELVRGAR